MYENECVPLFDVGRNVTLRADGADVIGRRLVAISGNAGPGNPPLVKHAAAGVRPFAAAGYSAPDGELVAGVRGGVLRLDASGAITANDDVQVGANGTVVKLAAGVRIGTALYDAANGGEVIVALNI